jgi:hypothetical protein
MLQLERQHRLQLLGLIERQRERRALNVFDMLDAHHRDMGTFNEPGPARRRELPDMIHPPQHLHRTGSFERLRPSRGPQGDDDDIDTAWLSNNPGPAPPPRGPAIPESDLPGGMGANLFQAHSPPIADLIYKKRS